MKIQIAEMEGEGHFFLLSSTLKMGKAISSFVEALDCASRLMTEGQILNGYHIIRRIGSGGFGDFLLRDPLLIGRTH